MITGHMCSWDPIFLMWPYAHAIHALNITCEQAEVQANNDATLRSYHMLKPQNDTKATQRVRTNAILEFDCSQALKFLGGMS